MGHIRVDMPNTNNKWIGFGLANIDTFIIRVGFELTNVNAIRILTRHEHDPSTRIANLSSNSSLQMGSCLFLSRFIDSSSCIHSSRS